MPPEKYDPTLDEEPFPNPFPEPSAWSLQWDLSALCPESPSQRAQSTDSADLFADSAP